MTRSRESKYFWYIEPLDSRSNAVIATRLPEENAIEDAITENGAKRNLWGCDHDFAKRIWKSKTDLGIDIEIYNRQGKSGKIRKCTFLFRRQLNRKKSWQKQAS